MESFEERRKVFMEWLKTEYKTKIDDLKCDMYYYPLYVPDGQGGFRTVIQTDVVDISASAIKSPFQENESL